MDEREKASGLDALQQIWNRRKRLAVMTFAGPFVAVATLSMSLPDLYRATATVLVERPQVAETFVKSSVTSETETRLHTISQQILSRTRLQELIDRFDLYSQLRKRMPLEAVVERMRRDIRMELKGVDQAMGRGTTIAFTLSYWGRDPDTVTQVTNTLVSMYIEENLKMRERQASGTAEFLRVQLEEMKKKMDDEERRVGEFKERHIGELPEQQELNLATLERLNTQLRLNSENAMRLMERLEREALTRQLSEAAGSLGSGRNPSMAGGPEGIAARIVKLNQGLTELRTRFSEKYPDVVRVKAEIAALEHELAEQKPEKLSETKPVASSRPSPPQIKKLRSEGESEMQTLQQEEKTLRQTMATYQRRIEIAPHREQEFQELSRDYKTMKELYNTQLHRYQEALVAESMEHGRKGDQFRLLDPAIVPMEPAGPNRAKLIVIGLVLLLALTAGVVVLAEQRDASFHTLDDLRAFTKVPVLVTIPPIVTKADASQKRRRVCLASTAATLGLAIIVSVSYYVAHENELLVWMLAGGRS